MMRERQIRWDQDGYTQPKEARKAAMRTRMAMFRNRPAVSDRKRKSGDRIKGTIAMAKEYFYVIVISSVHQPVQ